MSAEHGESVSYRCNFCHVEMSGIEETLMHNCISGCATVFVTDKNSVQQVDLSSMPSGSQLRISDDIPDQTGKLVAQWPSVETKALLRLISENRSLLSSRKAGLFKKVADSLHDLGISQSEEKVQNKWKALCKKYRTIVEGKKHTSPNGRKSVKWEFFDEMEQIIGVKPSIYCLHTVASLTPTSTTDSGVDPEKTHSFKRRKTDVGSSSPKETSSDTRLGKESEFYVFVMDYLKEMKDADERRSRAAEQRHQERMDVERKKLELFSRLIEKL